MTWGAGPHGTFNWTSCGVPTGTGWHSARTSKSVHRVRVWITSFGPAITCSGGSRISLLKKLCSGWKNRNVWSIIGGWGMTFILRMDNSLFSDVRKMIWRKWINYTISFSDTFYVLIVMATLVRTLWFGL